MLSSEEHPGDVCLKLTIFWRCEMQHKRRGGQDVGGAVPAWVRQRGLHARCLRVDWVSSVARCGTRGWPSVGTARELLPGDTDLLLLPGTSGRRRAAKPQLSPGAESRAGIPRGCPKSQAEPQRCPDYGMPCPQGCREPCRATRRRVF